MKYRENIKLSEYTTIGLGGNADYFINCIHTDSLKEALGFAKEKNIPVQVLSGGSNIIFADSGFRGLVLRIDLKGIEYNEDEKYYFAKVKAGENWDEFTDNIITKGYSGIECLSGIPGMTGATPIQNVGAYGQEVKDTIESVTVLDRNTLEESIIENGDCRFDYRSSRFKNEDRDKFIITEILFKFEKGRKPEIMYKELRTKYEEDKSYLKDMNLKDELKLIRKIVLEIRSSKSMLIDSSDPDSRSCGSFFMNPVLGENEFEILKSKYSKLNSEIPAFKDQSKYKLSAAWLVERAGFYKGYRKGGAGISGKHSLALVNYNGTSTEILSLAGEIAERVYQTFGIDLKIEPVIVLSD